jgi:hypothetical protein
MENLIPVVVIVGVVAFILWKTNVLSKLWKKDAPAPVPTPVPTPVVVDPVGQPETPVAPVEVKEDQK